MFPLLAVVVVVAIPYFRHRIYFRTRPHITTHCLYTIHIVSHLLRCNNLSDSLSHRPPPLAASFRRCFCLASTCGCSYAAQRDEMCEKRRFRIIPFGWFYFAITRLRLGACARPLVRRGLAIGSTLRTAASVCVCLFYGVVSHF